MVEFTASLKDTKGKFNNLSNQYKEKRGRINPLSSSSDSNQLPVSVRPLSSIQDPKSWAPPPKHVDAHGPVAAKQSVAAGQHGMALQPGQQPYYPAQPPAQPPAAYGQPAYGQPAYGQPAYGQPAYAQPAYAQPAYGQPPPAHAQPPAAYAQPAYPPTSTYAPPPSYEQPPQPIYGSAPPTQPPPPAVRPVPQPQPQFAQPPAAVSSTPPAASAAAGYRPSFGVVDPSKPAPPPRPIVDPKSFAPPPIVGNARPTGEQIEQRLNSNKLGIPNAAGVVVRSRVPSGQQRSTPSAPSSSASISSPPPASSAASLHSPAAPNDEPPQYTPQLHPAETPAAYPPVPPRAASEDPIVPRVGSDFMSELSSRMSGLSAGTAAPTPKSLAAAALNKKKPPPRPSASSKPKVLAKQPERAPAQAPSPAPPVPSPAPPVPPPAPRSSRAPMPLPPHAAGPQAQNRSSFSNEQLELATLWYTAEFSQLRLPAALPQLSFNATTSFAPETKSLNLSMRQADLSVLRLVFEWETRSPAAVTVSEERGPPPAALSPAQLIEYSQRFGENVARWAEQRQGQRVGDGECWTLAQLAIRDGCGPAALTPQGYVHGALVLAQQGGQIECAVEAMRRGDILQLSTAVFAGSRSGEHHTGVVVSVDGARLVVIEQNVCGSPAQIGHYDLSSLQSGLAQVFRVVGVEWVEPL